MQETLIFSKNNRIPKNKKKIFIGQWLLVDKRNNNKGSKVLKYQEKKQDKLKQFIYVKKIYNRVFRNLAPVLNHIHKKNYKEKDWEILIFYFLCNYIFFAYNKWILIKNLKKKHNFSPIETFCFKKNFFVQDDTKSFFDQLQTHKWDDWLFSNIIKSQNFNFKEKKINTKKKEKRDFNNLDTLKIEKLYFPKNNDK
jgi:putative transferase (TIGR04331 family)